MCVFGTERKVSRLRIELSDALTLRLLILCIMHRVLQSRDKRSALPPKRDIFLPRSGE